MSLYNLQKSRRNGEELLRTGDSATIWSWFSLGIGYWTWIWSFLDPRVDNWLFMSSPWSTLSICLTYVYIVKVWGPKVMKNRKPFDLRGVLILYNALQVVFSAWLFYEVSPVRKIIFQPFSMSNWFVWCCSFNWISATILVEKRESLIMCVGRFDDGFGSRLKSHDQRSWRVQFALHLRFPQQYENP